MTIPDTCKICGCEIVDGPNADRESQERGYCTPMCEEVDKKTRELDRRFMDQEGR